MEGGREEGREGGAEGREGGMKKKGKKRKERGREGVKGKEHRDKCTYYIYPTLYITATEWKEVMNHNSLP